MEATMRSSVVHAYVCRNDAQYINRYNADIAKRCISVMYTVPPYC